MMPDLRKILRLDIALIVLLVAGVAIGLFLFQGNAGLQLEEGRLQSELWTSEMRLRLVEERMSEIESQIREEPALAAVDLAEKEAIIETRRQRLEQEALAHAADLFPTREEAADVTGRIGRYVRQNNLIITRWESSDAYTLLERRSYPAISHSLDVEGEMDSLIGFLRELAGAPVVPVIRSIDMTPDEEEEGRWRMRLEIMVHYL